MIERGRDSEREGETVRERQSERGRDSDREGETVRDSERQ